MRIAVACDHAAYRHKLAVIAHLSALGHTVEDFGTASDASVDYPDYGIPAARSIASGRNEKGILICGTGIGMAITANKITGIRCALVYSVETAGITAAHNNPQMIAMGARFFDVPTVIAMVDAWLTTPFEARHQRRLDKITACEGASSC